MKIGLKISVDDEDGEPRKTLELQYPNEQVLCTVLKVMVDALSEGMSIKQLIGQCAVAALQDGKLEVDPSE